MSISNKIEMPRAVFWDWDGTIADSYGFLNDAHNFTLEKLGFAPFKDGEYKAYFGKPRDTLYPAIYKDKCEEAKDVFGGYVLENSHKIQVLDKSLEALEFFYNNNIEMGIVSNKKAELIASELKHLGWNKYFKVIIGAGDAAADKPSSAPLLLALEQANINDNRQNIWYIGDTENDLACARDAGCKAVFLAGHDDSVRLIAEYKPLVTFERYDELKEILVAI